MPTRINNQAVKLYSPTETRFNEKTSKCEWHEDYFQLATCLDVSEIILDNVVFVENIEADGTFDDVTAGTNTNVVPNKLRDTGADFITAGIRVGMTVQRATGGAFVARAKVTNVDSSTVLSLDFDLFTFSALPYEISFWEYEGEVTLANNSYEVLSTTSTGSFLQQASLTVGSTYRVTFDIISVSQDVEGDQVRILIGGVAVLTLDETDIIAKTYTVFGFAATNVFRLETDGGMVVTIDNIKIDLLYDNTFKIKDCENDAIQYSSVSGDILYSETLNQLKMSVDWSNVTCPGCYYIQVTQEVPAAERLERITDKNFNNAGAWNVGAGWTVGGGEAILSSGGGAGNLTQTSLAIDFKKSVSYNINMVVDHTSGDFDVKLYSGGIEILDLGNFSTSGNFNTSTGALLSDCDEIRLEPSAGAQNLTVLQLSALMDLTPVDFSYRTDCYQLDDSHDCTIKLNGTNLDNAFGIDFIGLGYAPFVRVKGELMTPIFEGDKENEEDSAGISKTLYFKSEEKKNLFLYSLPNYLHSFIRLLIGYDTFQVDDVDYISIDSTYAPEAERLLGKLDDLSSVTTELRLQDDLNENKFC